jgi:ADP-ribosylglycohydrolase
MIGTVDAGGRPAQAALARRRLAERYAGDGHPHPELAAALVVARGERAMSPSDLAGALGVAADVVCNAEAGRVAMWSPAVRPLRAFVASLPDRRARVRGCLLGGAVGDALGAPIEFARGDVRAPPPGRFGEITDDTQMTLFTAEGLLRAWPGDDPLPSIRAAYARWLATQTTSLRDAAAAGDGWLSSHAFLHARRAPGTTCLGALEAGAAVAQSKGCGGVMRVAPIGLVGLSVRDAFDLGTRAAAVTHGHPTGALSAGVLAALVTQLAGGVPLTDAVEPAVGVLRARPSCAETVDAVMAAVALAASGEPPTRARVESLGEGWVAEEALAIGLYCALAGGDVRASLAAAVEHRGDSDSTGSICGNLVGAELGVDAVPQEWLAGLEGADVIAAVADDLLDGGATHPERWPLA